MPDEPVEVKRGPGRPRGPVKKHVGLSITPETTLVARRAATREGMTLSGWVEKAIMERAKKEAGHGGV